MTDPWSELVTVALLGTDRRPLPDVAGSVVARAIPLAPGPLVAPATRLLDLAAGYRATHRAGARLPVEEVTPLPMWPPEKPVPPAAHELLLLHLERAEPLMLNLWLRRCQRDGAVVAADAWTPLIQLAAQSPRYDRSALKAVLGEPGRWFLEQNPAWRTVAVAPPPHLEQPHLEPPHLEPPHPEPPHPEPVVDSEGMIRQALSALGTAAERTPAAQLDLILSCPDPWPAEIIRHAWQLLGGVSPSGPFGRDGRRAGYRIGCQLPLAAYPEIAVAAEQALRTVAGAPREREWVREGFALCELAAWSRLLLEDAFLDRPDDVVRVPVPAARPPVEAAVGRQGMRR